MHAHRHIAQSLSLTDISEKQHPDCIGLPCRIDSAEVVAVARHRVQVRASGAPVVADPATTPHLKRALCAVAMRIRHCAVIHSVHSGNGRVEVEVAIRHELRQRNGGRLMRVRTGLCVCVCVRLLVCNLACACACTLYTRHGRKRTSSNSARTGNAPAAPAASGFTYRSKAPCVSRMADVACSRRRLVGLQRVCAILCGLAKQRGAKQSDQNAHPHADHRHEHEHEYTRTAH